MCMCVYTHIYIYIYIGHRKGSAGRPRANGSLVTRPHAWKPTIYIYIYMHMCIYAYK